MNYKQIVFDIDGTLIDTEYAVLHSLQDTIRCIAGKNVDIEELTFALGITGEDALHRLRINDVVSALSLWDKKCANIIIQSAFLMELGKCLIYYRTPGMNWEL